MKRSEGRSICARSGRPAKSPGAGAARGTAVHHRIGAGTANPGGCSTAAVRATRPTQSNRSEGAAQHLLFLPTPPAFSLICDFPTTPQSEAEATAGQPASRERTVTAHHAAACYRLYCSGPAAPTRPPLTRSLRSPHSPFPFQESSTSPAWHHPYATPRLLPAVMLCVGGRAPPRRSVWRGEHKQ